MNAMTTIQKWFDLCALEDIPLRGARRVNLSGIEIAIFRTSGNDVYAIRNHCPHKGGPLSEGIVHDSAVTCPLHAMVIDLKTGQARGADKGCVQTYPIEVRAEGRVFIAMLAD